MNKNISKSLFLIYCSVSAAGYCVGAVTSLLSLDGIKHYGIKSVWFCISFMLDGSSVLVFSLITICTISVVVGLVAFCLEKLVLKDSLILTFIIPFVSSFVFWKFVVISSMAT